MAEKESHPIRNRVIATVLASLILTAIPYTRRFVTSIAYILWHWVMSLATAIWAYLTSRLNVPWWGLLVLIALALPTIWRIAKGFLPKRNEGPKVQDYRSDFFFGAKCRWEYKWDNIPMNISSFCPICSTRLVFIRNIFRHDTTLRCETCSRDIATLDGEPEYVVGMIARQIERRINTGEWRRILPRNAKQPPAN